MYSRAPLGAKGDVPLLKELRFQLRTTWAINISLLTERRQHDQFICAALKAGESARDPSEMDHPGLKLNRNAHERAFCPAPFVINLYDMKPRRLLFSSTALLLMLSFFAFAIP